MERGAAAGQRGRPGGHRAAHPAGQRARVPGQRDQVGDRQVPRQRHVDGAVAAPCRGPARRAAAPPPGPSRARAGPPRRTGCRPRAGLAGRRPSAARTSAAPCSTSGRRAPSGSAGQRHRRRRRHRVGGPVRRHRRPLVHLHEADPADLLQERGRAARPGRGVPPVAGAQQPLPGPGDRDVRQPPLLPLPALPAGLDEGLPRVVQPLLVARRRPRRGPAGPRRRRAAGTAACTGWSPSRTSSTAVPVREDARGQPGHRDHVPLQALGGVHGQHLDRVGVHLDPAGLQAPLVVLGGGQVGEERAQRRRLGVHREVRGDLGEAVQVRPAGAGAARRPGRGRRPRRPAAASAPRRRPGRAAAGRCGGAARPARAPSAASRAVALGRVRLRRAEVVERLHQAGVGDRVGHPCGRLARARPAPAPGGRARRGPAAPIRHRAPVSSRASAAPAVGSDTTCSVLTRSRTSGVASSPPRPTSSTGMPARPQRPGDQVELGPPPAEHGHAAARAAHPPLGGVLRPHLGELGGQPLGLVQHGRQQRGADHARAAARPRRQHADVDALAPAAAADRSLATSSTSSSLRKLTDSGSTGAGSPSAVRKCSAKRRSAASLAPRQP